jgi:cysteine desulfuration protein SufE|tara:strand:+ start:248 stop:661 length:414 start_codon:yes stop_codon:yes gene_type:complete
MSIKEKIIFYKENLDCFEETIDKYKYLLDQGKKSKAFPEEYRKENFKVSGCQAQVWLVPKFKNNLLNFYSDSDAFISKGMITILNDIYGNNTPQDILKSDFELVRTLQLDTLLTQGRTNGVYAMLKKIKEYAEVFLK